MITQKLLDDIKSYEDYFFTLFKETPPENSGQKRKGGAAEAPLRPEQVDKVVQQALNRLKVKQDLVKKRNQALTAANKGKGGGAGTLPGKRKAPSDEDGDAAAAAGKNKKKKVDKKDKKERRKADLKGRSAKKDAKNKAAKGDGEAATPDVSADANVTEPATSSAQKKDQFMFGKIETSAADGKKKQMGKDFKKHLKNLQETKSKIAQAKSEDQAKGEALEEKFAWKNVMEKAQGVKVKDDETLIKKSIKR